MIALELVHQRPQSHQKHRLGRPWDLRVEQKLSEHTQMRSCKEALPRSHVTSQSKTKSPADLEEAARAQDRCRQWKSDGVGRTAVHFGIGYAFRGGLGSPMLPCFLVVR